MTAPASIPDLANMLERTILALNADGAGSGTYDIARTSQRIPRTVLDEISALAKANRMSVSLLINLLLDNYLREQGRKGYADLAPWYPDYVLRKAPSDT